MKIKLTETQLREFIESNVRKILLENDLEEKMGDPNPKFPDYKEAFENEEGRIVWKNDAGDILKKNGQIWYKDKRTKTERSGVGNASKSKVGIGDKDGNAKFLWSYIVNKAKENGLDIKDPEVEEVEKKQRLSKLENIYRKYLWGSVEKEQSDGTVKQKNKKAFRKENFDIVEPGNKFSVKDMVDNDIGILVDELANTKGTSIKMVSSNTPEEQNEINNYINEKISEYQDVLNIGKLQKTIDKLRNLDIKDFTKGYPIPYKAKVEDDFHDDSYDDEEKTGKRKYETIFKDNVTAKPIVNLKLHIDAMFEYWYRGSDGKGTQYTIRKNEEVKGFVDPNIERIFGEMQARFADKELTDEGMKLVYNMVVPKNGGEAVAKNTIRGLFNNDKYIKGTDKRVDFKAENERKKMVMNMINRVNKEHYPEVKLDKDDFKMLMNMKPSPTEEQIMSTFEAAMDRAAYNDENDYDF